MNTNAITKTLLQIWPGLADYATMLGAQAHNHALCSCNTPMLTNRIIDRIIDLNVKQQSIRHLAEQLNRVINKLPPDTQAVLHSYYRTDGVCANITKQARTLGIAERTFYRHLDRATTYIERHLTTLGINFFTWQDLLHQHPWIKATYLHQAPATPPQTKPRQTAPNHGSAHPHPRTKQAN